MMDHNRVTWMQRIFGNGHSVDIVFEGDGSLLVLEIAKNSLLFGDPTEALIRLRLDGSRETLLSESLLMPTAVAIGNNHALYISTCGVCAGDGQVIGIAPDKGQLALRGERSWFICAGQRRPSSAAPARDQPGLIEVW